jgi:hypothetical protein
MTTTIKAGTSDLGSIRSPPDNEGNEKEGCPFPQSIQSESIDQKRQTGRTREQEEFNSMPDPEWNHRSDN